jgi:dienelactone hydrolase
MEVLKRFSESSVATPPAEVVEEAATFASAEGPARARFYLPKDQPRAPVVVLVHGVHYKGIEEPRLVRFARSIASSGIAVMTPEVSALADYRVDPRSIDTVGASIRFAKERARGRRVGVMGFSFGGGLSLLAAADPRFSDDVAFVVGVGAHDDLARVTRFFAGEKIVDPDGRPQKLRAHDYGAMVFVYGHVDRFFPRDDAETARAAIRAWLHDERDAARATATKLSPASRERIEQLFQAKVEAIRPELLRAIDDLAPQMDRVSPHGHLGGLRAPVYLLHGSGDTVIPASETMWLARDVGPERLRDALVSPAVVHVELEGEPGWQEKWRVLHFMAGVLGEAEAVGG